MKKYSDYSKTNNDELTSDEISSIVWTKFKIIVPTEQDKQEIVDAFKHFHDEGYDSELITCNQLAHMYQNPDSVLVDESLYNELNSKNHITE